MGTGWSFYNDFWNFGSGSNLRSGTNPPYAVSDFTDFYPQFTNSVIPANVMQAFIDEANAGLSQARYHSAWTRAMALFVAHLCTLYLESYVDPASSAQSVADAGRAQGISTSQSVGDVSESVDIIAVTDPAWGDLNLTSYGQQLIRLGKLYGKGGMQIW